MRTFFAFLTAYLLALGAAQAQITNPPPGNQTIAVNPPLTATGTCTGTVINCILGIASQALPGTTQTVHAAQWNVGNTYVVTTASQVFTLDASSTLSPNGGMTMQNPSGQSFTITPAAGDTINPETGGTVGASVTVSAGLSLVTTDGNGKIHVAPTQASAAPPTQTITQGTNITLSGTCVGPVLNCAINAASGSGSPLAVTDGTHNVPNVGQITFTGNATVSGSSPNATVNVTGGSGGGSLTKIGTAVAANSTCLSWGVAVSGCVNGSTTDLSTLGYNALQLNCDSLKPGTSGGYFYLHVGEGAGGTPKTANYGWAIYYAPISTSYVVLSSSTTASANVGIAIGNGVLTTTTMSTKAQLSLATTSIMRNIRFESLSTQDPTNISSVFSEPGWGVYNGDQNAITAITLDLYSAANGTQETGAAGFVSGSCTLYGLAN